MFLNWYNSFFSLVLRYTVRGITNFFNESVLFSVLLIFLLLRVPYFYGMLGFYSFLLVAVFPLFMSLFFTRIFSSYREFLGGFVPSGTPMWIVSFVCLAETISYLVRPVVLLLRPFVNLSLGAVAMFSISSLTLGVSWPFIFLFFIFFYEIFVALVHWFIVCNILSFSSDH